MLALVAVVLLGASCLYATQPGDEMTFSVTTLNVYANTFTIAADCSPPDAIASQTNTTYYTWSTSTAAPINPTATTMSNDFFRPTTAPSRNLGSGASYVNISIPGKIAISPTRGDQNMFGFIDQLERLLFGGKFHLLVSSN